MQSTKSIQCTINEDRQTERRLAFIQCNPLFLSFSVFFITLLSYACCTTINEIKVLCGMKSREKSQQQTLFSLLLSHLSFYLFIMFECLFVARLRYLHHVCWWDAFCCFSPTLAINSAKHTKILFSFQREQKLMVAQFALFFISFFSSSCIVCYWIGKSSWKYSNWK